MAVLRDFSALATMVLTFTPAALACVPGPGDSPANANVLSTSVTGTVSASGLGDPQYVLSFPAVQRLVICATRGAVTPEQAETMLKDVPPEPADLERLGLLELGDGQYRIGYPVLTVADQALIRKVGREASLSLGRAFAARNDEFRKILSRYQHRELREEVAFGLVAGFLLNWEGLALSTELKLRAEPSLREDGGRYLVRSHELGFEESTRGLYWGSHTFPGPRISFSTFGDSDSIPRIGGIPDTLTEPMQSGLRMLSRDVELHTATRQVFIAQASDVLTAAGDIMARLAQRPASRDELATSDLSEKHLDATLSLLEASGYIRDKDGRFHIAVPVLLESDREMVEAVLTIGREVMTGWLKAHKGKLRHALEGLSPLQQGIEFRFVFNDVWHEILGWTGNALARQPEYQDPREPGYRYDGFVPLVWASELRESAN